MPDATTVTVKILDKDYQIKSPPDEVEALRRSAAHVDKRMREIKAGSGIVGLDRIGVMAALNVAHDLIKQADQNELIANATTERIGVLDTKLTAALTRLKAAI